MDQNIVIVHKCNLVGKHNWNSYASIKVLTKDAVGKTIMLTSTVTKASMA